jgi:hypothetical protein
MRSDAELMKMINEIYGVEQALARFGDTDLAKEGQFILEFLDTFGGFPQAADFYEELMQGLLDARTPAKALADLRHELEMMAKASKITGDELETLFEHFKKQSPIGQATEELFQARVELSQLRRGLSPAEIRAERFAEGPATPEEKKAFASIVRQIEEERAKIEAEGKGPDDSGFGRTGFGQFGQRIQDLINQTDPQKQILAENEKQTVKMGEAEKTRKKVLTAIEKIQPGLE